MIFKRASLIFFIVCLIYPAATGQANPNQLPDSSIAQVVVEIEALVRPVYITNAGDGSGRLFVLHQAGEISVIQGGEVLRTPFIDLTDKVGPIEGYTEQGLLGLAFHPDFASNGRFFVSYTTENQLIVISQYKVSTDDPNQADPTTEKTILSVQHPGPDHNGGHIAFGPDGNFYIGIGDGGGIGDPLNNAQNPMTLQGKILRINVDDEDRSYRLLADNPFVGTGEGANEVWAYGLRNPYRFSFDALTGEMYISDVGQDFFEEINFLPADFPGGANFGWSRFEGTHLYNEAIPEKPDMITPIVDYEHSIATGGCSVIGGYAYRGEAIPDLQGIYLYADWCSGEVYALERDEAGVWQSAVFISTGLNVTGIGLDEAGEIYMTYYSLSDNIGGVLKLLPSGGF